MKITICQVFICIALIQIWKQVMTYLTMAQSFIPNCYCRMWENFVYVDCLFIVHPNWHWWAIFSLLWHLSYLGDCWMWKKTFVLMGDTNIDYFTHKGLNTLEKRLNERQLMHSCITVYDICLDHIYIPICQFWTVIWHVSHVLL